MRIRILAALVALLLCTAPVCAAPAEIEMASGVFTSEVNAKAAVVLEAQTGRVVFAQNEHEPLPIASTTKILTALIALEQPDIDAPFQVDPQAIKVEGSSMGLQEGDVATLRALATGMLLASGNDGANAAAVRIAGSIPAFAQRMNERAGQIGMTNSSFETPSGLDGENHYSTAYDMALLAREAIRNDAFAAICSQYRMRATYGNPPYERWLVNHNRLLNTYEGAIGVKTGFTKKAGRCLVSAAERDGITLICVTLGCPDDWRVHKGLLDRGFSELVLEDLSERLPDIVIPVTGGTQPQVQALHFEAAAVPVPSKDARVSWKIRTEPFLYAPVEAGQYLGEVEMYLDGELVFSLALTAGENVPLLYEYKEKKNPFRWLRDLFGG